MPATSLGDIYLELYLRGPDTENHVGLYRSGTRVLEEITQLDAFQREPWNSGYLEGIIDAPFLSLTPGTRTGIVQDSAFAEFCKALIKAEHVLVKVIEEQKKAEEERVSRQMLRTIQKAFREALLALPVEEYNWFDIHTRGDGQTERYSTRREGKQSLTQGLP